MNFMVVSVFVSFLGRIWKLEEAYFSKSTLIQFSTGSASSVEITTSQTDSAGSGKQLDIGIIAANRWGVLVAVSGHEVQFELEQEACLHVHIAGSET